MLWILRCCHHFRGSQRLVVFFLCCSEALVHLLPKRRTPRFVLLLKVWETKLESIETLRQPKKTARTHGKQIPTKNRLVAMLPYLAHVVPCPLKSVVSNFTKAFCSHNATLPSNYGTYVAQNWTLDCLAIQLSTRKSCSRSVHVDNDLTRTGWFLFIRFEAVISRGINLKVAQNVKRKQTVLIWEPNLWGFFAYSNDFEAARQRLWAKNTLLMFIALISLNNSSSR